MEEVVPAMLGRLRGNMQFFFMFVWSQKECQPVEFEGGAPILWGKPLERVYEHWPRWNKSNTIIINHKVDRVGCNHGPNIIVPKPFSVVDMENLGDDLLHLKSTLWPLLETLYGSKDVRHFHKRFCNIMAAAEHTVTKLIQTVPLLHGTGDMQGEGTTGPKGSWWILSPHLASKFMPDCAFGCV
jgi:hypothetical protein